jgi:hypothetical protein
MPETDLLALFVAPLDDLGIDYMVTGSVASMLYGEPRLTNDVDIVIDLRPKDVPRVRSAFASTDFYCPPETEILVEVARSSRGHFNVLHLPTAQKADFYPAGQEWLHQWAFPRSQRLRVGSRAIRLAPPEYVIVRKLIFFREGGSSKHLRDIRAVMATRGAGLDLEAIGVLAAREGVDEIWETMLRREE